jgi:hypothetical protein
LLHAKDLAEVMRLHSEYVQNQMRVPTVQRKPEKPKKRFYRLINRLFLGRNVRSAGGSHAALQLKSRCDAQN